MTRSAKTWNNPEFSETENFRSAYSRCLKLCYVCLYNLYMMTVQCKIVVEKTLQELVNSPMLHLPNLPLNFLHTNINGN